MSFLISGGGNFFQTAFQCVLVQVVVVFICTNMFYMSVNKRGELVEAMVSYKLYISYNIICHLAK